MRPTTHIASALALVIAGVVLAGALVPAAPPAAAQPGPLQPSVYLPLVIGPAPSIGCCLSAEEAELARLINEHRAANGLPAAPLSKSLTQVAQLHVRDLFQYRPNSGTDSRGQACNLHSWSANGPWSPVCYTSDHYYASGMWVKPREITGGVYQGYGYENAYGGSGGFQATAQGAFNAWKNSPGHNAVMLEQGIWAGSLWPAMGVGIYEGYAVVWFGDVADPAGAPSLPSAASGGGR